MDVDNFTGNKPFPKNLKCGVLGATGYVKGRDMTINWVNEWKDRPQISESRK